MCCPSRGSGMQFTEESSSFSLAKHPATHNIARYVRLDLIFCLVGVGGGHSRGVLRFGLGGSVRLMPQNPYPFLGVILAENSTRF